MFYKEKRTNFQYMGHQNEYYKQILSNAKDQRKIAPVRRKGQEFYSAQTKISCTP